MAYRAPAPRASRADRVERLVLRPKTNGGLAVAGAVGGLVLAALVGRYTWLDCTRTGPPRPRATDASPPPPDPGTCRARTLSWRGLTSVAFALDEADRLEVVEQRGRKRSTQTHLVLVAKGGARTALEPAGDAHASGRRYQVARDFGLFQLGRDPAFARSFGGVSVALSLFALTCLLLPVVAQRTFRVALEVDRDEGWLVVRRFAFGVRREPVEMPLDEVLEVVNGGTRKAPRVQLLRARGEPLDLVTGAVDDAELRRVRDRLRAPG